MAAKWRGTERGTLLKALGDLGYGQAESERNEQFARHFLPILAHLRAFETDVVLVVGDRGGGKSELFRAVFREELWQRLREFAPELRLPGPAEAVSCVAAYPAGRDFPDPRGLLQWIEEDESLERAHDLWYAYAVRCLAKYFSDGERERLAPLLEPPGADPGPIMEAFAALGQKPLLALDRLDAELERRNKWLFLGYDELDTLGSFDWRGGLRATGGLLRFWSAYARRWRRLRAKIFLRTDLFRHYPGPAGADFAKLAATRLELEWTDRNLWALLVKRLANAVEAGRDEAIQCFREAAGPKIDFQEREPFGAIPKLRSAEDAWPLIERLAGRYMGANPRKGLTRRWLLDHLRDGHGKVSPRNLVRLVECAAASEQENSVAAKSALLAPVSLRRALARVSGDHVANAEREWPWLKGLRGRLEGELLPAERRALARRLRDDWEQSWEENAKEPVRPPGEDAQELIDYLCEIGVLRPRRDGRLDAPDIYRLGLGLLRKGGVRSTPRPRSSS